MENKARKYFKKVLFLAVFLLIISGGIFLRAYHFSDWMHFELDQSRDANLISDAVDRGAGDLPLLGPKARGTLLRLGPVFYYFMYFSAKVFGNTPPMMALPVLFFAALSLPIFYLLMRRYFERAVSLGLMAVFASSIFLVMYSRFAWNPNLLPFFLLLFFYALLRTVDRQEKNRGLWLAISSVSAAIVTQLHFLAFVLIPIFLVVFLLWKRPRIAWKSWLGAIFLALLIYMPVVINEIKSGGKNTEQLLETITDRTGGGTAGLVKKTAIASVESARYYFLIVSGKDDSDFWNVNPAKNTNQYCDEACVSLHPLGILSAFLLLAGLVLSLVRLKGESDPLKSDFLQLNLLWFFLTSLIFVLLADDLSPRFFLLSLPLPFVFLGIILNGRKRSGSKMKAPILILALGILIIANLHETSQRFSELARAPQEASRVDEDKILKEKMRVTFSQEEMIVKHILKFSKQNSLPVFYMSSAEYRPAFEYLFERAGILYDEISKNKVYREGNYFLILPFFSSETGGASSYLDRYAIVGRESFGTLAVIRLKPIETAITAAAKDFTPVPQKEVRSKAPRYKWNQIFSNKEDNDEEE